MSLAHSPKVVTDGLVFYTDMGNVQKSWKGAPATNLFTETNLNNWSKSAIVSTSQFITPFNNPSYIITDDDTANWESINRSITVANNSSSHTISLMVRKTYGGTSTRLGFNVSYSGGTTVNVNARFNSDTGAATFGTVIDYGDWWYWYFSLANNSTGNTSLNYNFYPATGVHNGSDNSTVTGTAIVGEFMLVAGSVAARFVNGTRSNTQALLDPIGNNTITATSLTYSSNGSFSFNGSSDLINASNNSILNVGNKITVNAWVFIGSTASYQPIVAKVNSGFTLGWELSNSSGALRATLRPAPIDIASGALTLNSWNMTTMTFDGTTLSLYLNGIFQTSGTGGSVTLDSIQDMYIGARIQGNYFNGNISNAQVYNRSLTQAEIQQNFNALRGRYGI